MDVRTVRLKVNGMAHAVNVDARRLLSDVLRSELGLKGTNVGCEQGICGSCTVLLDGAAVRSCLTFAVQAEGRDVMTVEGLSSEGALSPLQEAFLEHQALQCGFCTPGFLMTARVALEERADWDRAALRDRLGGNLCRCTGYQTIVDAVLAAQETRRRSGEADTR